MDANELAAKLAVLEERLGNHIEDTTELLRAIKDSQDGMKAEMARYKGFMGGVTFVVSALFTVLMLLKEKVFG